MACESSSLHSEDMNMDSGAEEATCGVPRLAESPRAGGPGAQAPLPHVRACPNGGGKDFVCVVSGCSTPLTKKYHQRCRICAEHMQSGQLLVGEEICRFCQKCKRFHPLTEFQGSKRSCEKVLQRHNAKQRLQRSLKATKAGHSSRRSSKRSMLVSELSNPDTPSSQGATTTGTGSVSAPGPAASAPARPAELTLPEKVDPALVSLFAAQAQLVQQQQAQLAALQAQTKELRGAMPPPPPQPQPQPQPQPRMTRRRSLETQRALSLLAFPSTRLPEVSDRDIQMFLNNVEGASWHAADTIARDSSGGSGASATGAGPGSLMAGPPVPAGGPLGGLVPAPSLSLSIMERLTSGPLDSIVDQALLEFCMNEWGNGAGEGRAAAARLPPVLGLPEQA